MRGRFRRHLRRRIPLPRMRLPSILAPADLLTLANAMAGFLAIVTLAGDPGRDAFGRYPDVLFASVLLLIGMVADSLDGIVARKYGASQLGGDLDTLADAVSFVLAPAVMIFTVFGKTTGSVVDATGVEVAMCGAPAQACLPVRSVMVAGLVVLMGLLRLARFNANPYETENTTFQGLPTPGCAAGVVALVLANEYVFQGAIKFEWALAAMAVLAFLMMSNVPYPKSRGGVVKIALALAGAAGFIVFGILFLPERQGFFIGFAFALASFAIAVSPFLLRLRQARDERRTRNE
ncbi:MAG TPA: CDP-alcohol phosphatidyltransferase family protein [Candidatus Thermoplasmatota archaeon]|nr:CDP-alcohol phosphatidyltransferase family protein [Candidatus Thermoplasmatota archaeon]